MMKFEFTKECTDEELDGYISFKVEMINDYARANFEGQLREECKNLGIDINTIDGEYRCHVSFVWQRGELEPFVYNEYFTAWSKDYIFFLVQYPQHSHLYDYTNSTFRVIKSIPRNPIEGPIPAIGAFQ